VIQAAPAAETTDAGACKQCGGLGQVATRQNAINELKRASIVMRVGSYRRPLFILSSSFVP
jgi:hypothetical protein